MNVIDSDIWTSNTEGPHKPLSFAADYNMTILIETKDLPPEYAKKVKLDNKAYIMLDMALNRKIHKGLKHTKLPSPYGKPHRQCLMVQMKAKQSRKTL